MFEIKKILFLALILGFFLACSSQDGEKDHNSTQKEPFKDRLSFSLKMLHGDNLAVKKEGENVRFESGGKGNLFIFFTTWCTPCLAEIPHLNRIEEKYREDFNIIGVLLEDKSKDELESFVLKHKIHYKIANGEETYLFARILGGVGGIPMSFLYAKDGRLIKQYQGVVPSEMLEIDIAEAL